MVSKKGNKSTTGDGTESTTETINISDNKELAEALAKSGFKLVPLSETESQTTEDTPTETNETNETKETNEKDTTKTINFILGTPEDNPASEELTEEKIMVMTSDQVQENMPKIREYILNSGGVLNGN